MSSEEKLWQQRSKLHWLKKRDQNTSYFQVKASQRFGRNNVKLLWNSNGVRCEGDDQLEGLFIEYFRKLFSTSNPNQLGDDLGTIPRVVSDSMNTDLLIAFTRQEVGFSLKQMAPLKARVQMACLLYFINIIGAPLVICFVCSVVLPKLRHYPS